MAYASVTYTSASGTTFALTNSNGDPIPYIRQSDIKVYVNTVLQTLTTDYTFNTAGTAIVLNSAVSGATVLLQRITDITDPTVVYTAGSTLTAQDLNNADNQIRYGLQEFQDSVQAGGGVPDGDKGDIVVGGKGTIWTVDTGAITSAKIANDTIVDADINSAAAITGTKIQQGSTSDRGTVQLTDSISSTSTTTAATPNSVKTTYDAALLKTGGTMTGPITFASNQTFLSDYQEFTSNGTWTKPANCTMVYVELVGGGSGGGSGANNPTTAARGGGSGGAGGAGLYKLFDASSLTATVSVTIGAGGVGAAGVSLFNAAGDNGNSGGNTQFGSYLESGAAGGGLGGTDVAVAGGSVSFKASTYTNAGAGGTGLVGNAGAGILLRFLLEEQEVVAGRAERLTIQHLQ